MLICANTPLEIRIRTDSVIECKPCFMDCELIGFTNLEFPSLSELVYIDYFNASIGYDIFTLMKRILLLSIILALSNLICSAQGTLVEDTIILHLNHDDIDNLLQQNGFPIGLLPTPYEVDVHRVIYNTPDVHGLPTTASGLVCLPTQDSCAMPMMAYLHGTKILKAEAFYGLQGEWFLGVLTASSGYAMCMPDYLGLGAGPGIHPYQHARSEATASVDILRSCRIICEQESRPLNDQLFLIGYSQGGHSVMATHRMIQEELSDEFVVTASAPGSGPYDMSGAQLDMVASFEPYAVPGYLPFLIQSYQHVYGNLYTTLQEIYVPPYDQTLPPLLDGNSDMGQLNAAMPPVPRDIFQQTYQDAFFSNTQHPAQVALRDNDVFQWIPDAPVLFNYCRSDEEVSYLNTIVASTYMLNGGALSVEAIERDTVIGHFACAEPSILFSKLWFDSMADLCGENSLGIQQATPFRRVNFYPNPSNGSSLNFDNEEPILVQITDANGRVIRSQTKVQAKGTLQLDGLKPGVVFVELLTDHYKLTRPLVIQ